MLKVLMARLQQGHRTSSYPKTQPDMPDRFRGAPQLCRSTCAVCSHKACVEACPTAAISLQAQVDLGRCLFCNDCRESCPSGAISYSTDYRLSTLSREDLVADEEKAVRLAAALDQQARRLFGRSLKLRQVSAGGCNACEADTNVLNTLTFDLGRFGIQFVASPRHADGVLVTGPVSENMKLGLEKTWEAIPDPKIAIAVGACAISGGPYAGHPEVCGGADSIIPIDLYVPGCPPNPWTILDGLLRLLGRIE